MARNRSYPGNIEERSGSYRVRLTVDGERHRWTLSDATRTEAEEFARQKHRELREQAQRRAAGLPTGIRFSGLVRRFREDELPTLTEGTRRSYRDSLKPLEHYFVNLGDDPKLEQIRTGHVRRYLSWRRTHGPSGKERTDSLSNRTLNKDRAVLHRLFEFAFQMEFVDSNPVARTEPKNTDSRDPVILSEEQYSRLIQEAQQHSPMLHTYAVFLGETGARCESEALWTRWQDLDLEEGFVWLSSDHEDHRTKSGEGRWVPLTGRLEKRLRQHAAQFRMRTYSGDRTEWIFHHTIGRRNHQAGERIGSLRRAFSTICENANLPGNFTQHDLRHRRVTSWLANGKSPALVQEAMGHSNLRTTLKYTHLARNHLRALVDNEENRERLEALRS